MQSTRSDRGQAVVLLLAVVVLAALAVIAVGLFSRRIVDLGRAQTAADAAALAAVVGGRQAATRFAADNGGRLIGFAQSSDDVTVVVEVGGERATARATNGP
jgi:hypothetical protein